MSANRRFGRRKQSGSLTFKAGLMICVWLSVVVLFVPLAANGVRIGKEKVRDVILSMGYVDPDVCVVTEGYALDCTGRVAGTPLKDALPQFQATIADEQRQRQEAEGAVADARAAVLRMKTMLANQQSTLPYAAGALKPAETASAPQLGTQPVEVKRAISNGDVRPAPAQPALTDNTSPDEGYVPAEQDEAQ